MQYLLDTGDLGELPPVADFESRSSVPPVPTARIGLQSFLNHVEAVARRVPIIYTAPAYWIEQGSREIKWKRYPLWIANYNVQAPTVPAPWTSWTFWQYSTTGPGHMFGMESMGLDMDWYQWGQGFDYVFNPTEPTHDEKVEILWAAHPDLH